MAVAATAVVVTAIAIVVVRAAALPALPAVSTGAAIAALATRSTCPACPAFSVGIGFRICARRSAGIGVAAFGKLSLALAVVQIVLIDRSVGVFVAVGYVG